MKGSIRVGTIAGIAIYVHITFILLIGFFAWAEASRGGTLASVLLSTAFTLSLFACVLLHELGHALAAKRYNIGTRDITLLPIGGLARLERMPEEPKQELVVAIAGPMVNVVIAVILLGVLALAAPAINVWQSIFPLRFFTGNFLLDLAKLNIYLVAFNMIPAFPMDGGRVVRAFLASVTTYSRATRIAARLGQSLAFVFALDGLGIVNVIGSPGPNVMLVLIALFVWVGAAQEAGAVEMRSSLDGVKASDAMITDFFTLHPNDRLQRAVDATLDGSQNDFPIAEEGGQVLGILTRQDLIQALAQGGLDRTVDTAMRRNISTCLTTDSLNAVLERLSSAEIPVIPVLNQNRLVGIITPENIGEYLAIRSALGKVPNRPRPGGPQSAADAGKSDHFSGIGHNNDPPKNMVDTRS